MSILRGVFRTELLQSIECEYIYIIKRTLYLAIKMTCFLSILAAGKHVDCKRSGQQTNGSIRSVFEQEDKEEVPYQ